MAAIVGVLAVDQGGPGYFLQLGPESKSWSYVTEILGQDVPTPLGDSHDGRFFWLLARDPMLSDSAALASRLDRPTYRSQRIGYPALAWAWKLGGEDALLWGLVITNLMAVMVGTFFTTDLVTRRGGTALGGYLFVINPLVWLSVLFDFSDAVALAALVGVVWALRRGQVGAVVILGIIAALAKESTLLGLGSIAIFARGLTLKQRSLVALPAGLAALGWRAYVISRPNFSAGAQVQEFAVVPFSGFLEAWRQGWSRGYWFHGAIAVGLVLVAAGVVVLWRMCRSIELCAALPYALFVPFLSGQVIGISVNSIRAVGPVLTLGAIGLLAQRAAGGHPVALSEEVRAAGG